MARAGGGRRRRGDVAWMARTLATAFLTLGAIQTMRPMVSYRALELGASAFDLGVVAASYGLLSFVFAAPLGSWVDRFGEPRFVLLGTATTTATAFALAAVDHLVAVIAAQAVLGLGQVISLVALQTIVANGGDKAGRDGRFGAWTVMGSLTQIAGPVAAGFLYDTAGFASTRVFALTAVPAVGAVVVGLTLWRRPPPRSDGRGSGRDGREPFLRAVGGVMRRPAVPHAMLASVAVLTTIDLLIAYLPAYGEANGIPAATIGLMLGARALGSVVSRVLMLPMLRRWSRRQLLVVATFVPAATVALLPTTTVPVLLVVLLAVAGFGLGLGQPLSMSWIADAVPREVRGTALGVRITGNRLGQFVVPIGVGAIAGATGLAAIFVVCAATLGVSSWIVARAPTDGRA